MAHQRFVEDATGTLEFYPPEQGVASAATVALYQSGNSEIQAAASATIASASTTVAAAVAKGARSLTVASATGVAADQRFLVQEGGRVWVCDVEDIATTTLYPRQRVPFALTTAATVKGYRLSYAITATHTEDRDDNYRAHWAYTIGGVAFTYDQTFDVVSAYPADVFPTTLDDVTASYPWVKQHLLDHDLDGARMLATVWSMGLVPLLSSRSMRIERVRDLAALVPLHVALVNKHLIENLAMIDPDYIERLHTAREIVDSMVQYVLADVSWYDSDDDLSVSDGEEHVARTYIAVSR